MKTSPPPRNTMARNPSHFGSYRKSPGGTSATSLASIGSTGGSMGKPVTAIAAMLQRSAAARYTATGDCVEIHLVDGTYELFRHYYAVPRARDADGREVGAVRGVLASVLAMINGGATHVGVATDHIIESFRNRMWPGYKTGDGIDPDLLSQFPLLEEALTALGIATWPMVEYEADDALASASAAAERDARVGRVFICTPDKDLAQSVRGTRVVQLIRRTRMIRDEAG